MKRLRGIMTRDLMASLYLTVPSSDDMVFSMSALAEFATTMIANHMGSKTASET